MRSCRPSRVASGPVGQFQASQALCSISSSNLIEASSSILWASVPQHLRTVSTGYPPSPASSLPQICQIGSCREIEQGSRVWEAKVGVVWGNISIRTGEDAIPLDTTWHDLLSRIVTATSGTVRQVFQDFFYWFSTRSTIHFNMTHPFFKFLKQFTTQCFAHSCLSNTIRSIKANHTNLCSFESQIYWTSSKITFNQGT